MPIAVLMLAKPTGPDPLEWDWGIPVMPRTKAIARMRSCVLLIPFGCHWNVSRILGPSPETSFPSPLKNGEFPLPNSSFTFSFRSTCSGIVMWIKIPVFAGRHKPRKRRSETCLRFSRL